MAFVMAYTDNSGIGNGGTFWKATIFEVDAFRKRGKIVYCGWKNQTFYNEGKNPVMGWQKTYQLSPYNFDAGLAAAGVTLDSQLAACDALAILVKDIGEPPQNGLDENGNPYPDLRVSFFENATQV